MRRVELRSQETKVSTFFTEPLGSGLGASIKGLKLGRSLGHETFDRILHLLTERQVLYFHDQDLRPEELLQIARLFGKPQVHPIWPATPGYPEVLRVAKNPGEEDPITSKPMTVTSFFEMPSKIILLYSDQDETVCDYLFTSLTEAFDGLSRPMQDFLANFTAMHSPVVEFGPDKRQNAYFQGQASSSLTYSDAIFEQTEHPLIHVHPETGRKSLYVNETFTRSIIGLKEEESAYLLRFLFAHCARPEFGCRIPIRPKSLVICDSRVTTQATTRASLGQSRLLYGVAIANEETIKSSQDLPSPNDLLI